MAERKHHRVKAASGLGEEDGKLRGKGAHDILVPVDIV